MSVFSLLKEVTQDTIGPEVAMRIVGTRAAPAKMVIQIAVVGSANVQLQGRIARDAPWQDIGPARQNSVLLHVDAIQYLRAVTTNVATKGSVSVWSVWSW